MVKRIRRGIPKNAKAITLADGRQFPSIDAYVRLEEPVAPFGRPLTRGGIGARLRLMQPPFGDNPVGRSGASRGAIPGHGNSQDGPDVNSGRRIERMRAELELRRLAREGRIDENSAQIKQLIELANQETPYVPSGASRRRQA